MFNLTKTDEAADDTSAKLNNKTAALTAKLTKNKSIFKGCRKELNEPNEEVYNLTKKVN